ncbi:MAG: DUF3137 domain-containing protein [Planctomycetota bacterium]
MKTLEELKEFYTNELSFGLKRLDTKRRQIMRNTVMALFPIFILCLIPFCIAEHFHLIGATKSLKIIFFLLIGAIILGVSKFRSNSVGYNTEFKQQVISKVIAFLEPGLTYDPFGLIDQTTFKTSELVNCDVDRYSGEDRVDGIIGKTQITFSEVHAEYVTVTTNEGKTRAQWHTIFKGLFFVADFNKDFHGQTLVFPDTAEKLFGGLGRMLQSWNSGRMDLIKLEDLGFEREFVVYGSDQIEARYILSTSLMRRILDFKKKTRMKIYLSFSGSKVYVALPKKYIFKPKYFSSLSDFTPIRNYYQDLALAIGIVDDLNLNTRIWTKE